MIRTERRTLSQLAPMLANYGITHGILRKAARLDSQGDPDFPAPVGGSRARGYRYDTPAVTAWAKDRDAAMLKRQRRRDERAELCVAADLTAQPGLYFVQCGDFVKIGIAVDIVGRLSAIQVGNPYPVSLIGKIIEPDTVARRALEQTWHMYWRHAHHRGEWFHFTDELRAAIVAALERSS